MKNSYINVILNWIRPYTAFGLIFLLAVLMALMFQGSRGLFEPDEGRYTNVALQILQRNDWISLFRNEWSMHFTKPPVTYWSIASSMAVFGNNEWAARLPMALAFVATVALMYGLGRGFAPKKPWLPALLYMLSPVPFLAANTINTDTLLCLFITAFFYCYVNVVYLSAKQIWLDVMWLMLGFAFLTKGPPSLLALLVVLVHAALYGRLKTLLRPLGLVLFVLVGLLWYALVVMRHPGLLDYFLGYEVVARIASNTHNRAPEWYGFLTVYLPVLLAACLPAVLLKPWKKTPSQDLVDNNSKQVLLRVWLCLPLLVFSISSSKMPLYVLWLVPALILLLAGRLQSVNFGRSYVFVALVWGVVLLGMKYVAQPALRINEKDSSQYAEQLRELLPAAPKRLVFIDTSARYGLALYFPVTVSKISLQPFDWRISDSPYDHTLTLELANKPAGGRIFILMASEQQNFLKQLQRSGHQAVLLGVIGKRKPQLVYTLSSEFGTLTK
jgi:4-amino-4-deoxy-L-arabinose transferase-like glycosyltransferase